MMINEKKLDKSASKELKIRLPMSQHLTLHSIKVLTGKQISEVVEEALTAYLQRAEAQQAGARLRTIMTPTTTTEQEEVTGPTTHA